MRNKRDRKKVAKIKNELTRARGIGMVLYNELETGKHADLTEEERYSIQKSIRSVEKMYASIRVEAL
jgi:hypothetical protein